MDLTIHSSFLPFLDAEESLSFYRDALGFAVELDVGYGDMRWITLAPPGQNTAIVLYPPGVGHDLSEEDQALLHRLIAKGSFFAINLATPDLDATFAALEASGAEIVQEPIAQDYGIHDAAVRDPAGNLLRIQQLPHGEHHE